jgi:hypothetical protein
MINPLGFWSLCENCKIGTSAAEAALISLCLGRGPSLLPLAGAQDELKLRHTKILEFSHTLFWPLGIWPSGIL